MISAGLVYYSDCRADRRILRVVREQIRRAAGDLPMVSVTLKPMPSLGPHEQRIVLQAERGPLTMFRQILMGLEALTSDVAFLCEHDVMYALEHFRFTPPARDRFYYNQHRWQLCMETGRAVHYLCSQTSGCCADRDLLVEHYRKRVALIERDGWSRNLGFEPGTNSRSRAIDGIEAGAWFADTPNIDIRHGKNLTKTRWSTDGFRNKNACLGWTESDRIPGWGVTLGRPWEFLQDAGRLAKPFTMEVAPEERSA